jgi:hypothetical protein
MYYDAFIDELTIQTLTSGVGTTLVTLYPGWASQGAIDVRFSVCGIGSRSRLFVEENRGTGWKYIIKNVNPTGVYFESGTPGILFYNISMTNWAHGTFAGISAGIVGPIATSTGNTSGSTAISITLPTSVERGDALCVFAIVENGNVVTSGSDSKGNSWTVQQTPNDGFNSVSLLSCLVTNKILPGDSVSVNFGSSFYSSYALCVVKLECCGSVVTSNSSQVFSATLDTTTLSCGTTFAPVVGCMAITSNSNLSGNNLILKGAPIVWGASSSKRAYIGYYPNAASDFSLSGGYSASSGQINATIAFDV